MEAYGIVPILFLYEPAQDLPGGVPVPARGRHKGRVERLGRLGHARERRHDGKMCVGLVDLSRLEVHPTKRRAQFAVGGGGARRRRRLSLLLLSGPARGLNSAVAAVLV